MYLLLALCTIASFNIVQMFAELPECKKYECAKYELLEKKKGYEIRRYPAYKVASVRSKGLNYDEARTVNFFKLLRYIRGENERHEHISMVIPILTVINKKTWSGENNEQKETVDDDYGVAYFMPRALPDPPKGKDVVEIIDIGPITAYVSMFPGYANKSHVFEVQKKLHDNLMDDGVEFDHSFFVAGEYTKFNVLHDRHNELIYLGKR